MIDTTEIKGLVFDFGGTLDTNGCHWGRNIWHAYEKVGLLNMQLTYEQFVEAYVFAERSMGKNVYVMPNDTFRQMLNVKLNLQMDYICRKSVNCEEGWENVNVTSADESSRYASCIVDVLYNKMTEQMAHTRKVLSALQGCYPMALVTNFYGNMHTVLNEFNLNTYFPHVIESAVVGVRKPAPAIFELGVEALGLKPHEVVVIGDSLDKDIIPANAIGCKTVWLKGEGWKPQPDSDIPDMVISSLEQLTAVLLNANQKNQITI